MNNRRLWCIKINIKRFPLFKVSLRYLTSSSSRTYARDFLADNIRFEIIYHIIKVTDVAHRIVKFKESS